MAKLGFKLEGVIHNPVEGSVINTPLKFLILRHNNIYILNTFKCYMKKNTILTEKAIKVINKRLRNEKLTQQDSNYLSRFVRPKLRDILSIDAKALLNNLEYNRKARALEKKIRDTVLKNVQNIDAIIVCGSAAQTNYVEYEDIDIIIATSKVLTKSIKEKRALIKRLEEIGKKEGLILDIQIYSRASIISQYPHSPSLIYQLKNSKIVYGYIKLPRKAEISNLDLKMKLDWSEDLSSNSKADEIYYAIRNAILVLLLMNKKVSNEQLKQNMLNAFGQDLSAKLKYNTASPLEKKLAWNYLNLLVNYLETELIKTKWENITIENL